VMHSQLDAGNPENSPSFMLRGLAIFAVLLALYAESARRSIPTYAICGIPLRPLSRSAAKAQDYAAKVRD
jgi:hypothetical protein